MLTFIRLKDHDVTWLYGPLQTGSSNIRPQPTPPASQLSRTTSFGSKKPILKKRSMSEIMLQRSLSSSTLMKQATDALRAQQCEKVTGQGPELRDQKVSDFLSSSGSETPLTRTTTHMGSSNFSSSTSGMQTPSTKRHIHFNDKVEQCIAINCDNEDHLYHAHPFEEDSESSEDELLIMHQVGKNAKEKINRPSTPRNSFSNENKTIAMLPSTTLNCREDTPDPATQGAKEKQRGWNPTSVPNTSSLPQAIRSDEQRANFLYDEEEDDADLNWQPSSERQGSLFPRGGIRLQSDDDEENEGIGASSLRRTPSGMFMPYNGEDSPREGFLGKMVDTVNTAKDIAHVIWNVGWRG